METGGAGRGNDRRDRRDHREGTRWGRWIKAGLLVGGAIGVPALANALIRRRARPPQAPQWGHGHRYTGRFGELAFQELGEGPPLLLLHSFGPGHDAEEWRAAAEILAERHRVYAPDLPGWARSAAPGVYRPGVYVDVIADFLAGVVREPAVVAAAGLSAAYALEVAGRHADRLRALALITPVGLEPDSRRLAGRWQGLWGLLPALRRVFGLPVVGASALDLVTSRAALVHHLRHEVYAAPERVDAALVEHHYRASHRPRARQALAAYLAGSLRPSRQLLAGLTVPSDLPLWIAWGREAVDPPVACADLWLHNFPWAELEVFEGVGSLPHAEVPATYCYAFGQFVAGLPD